jgi:hypothetical protein
MGGGGGENDVVFDQDFDGVWPDWWMPTFRRNILPPSSEEQHRRNIHCFC